MHPKQFAKIVEDRLDDCYNLLAVKGEEYSRHNDRLHNFKSAASMDGTTPTRSLWGMWKKHLVSIKDMIDDIDAGIVPSQAMVREKLGDNINYTLLLEGLIEEQRVEPYAVPVEEIAALEAELAAELEAEDGGETAGNRGQTQSFPQEAAKNLGSVPCFPSEDCLGNVCRRRQDA